MTCPSCQIINATTDYTETFGVLRCLSCGAFIRVDHRGVGGQRNDPPSVAVGGFAKLTTIYDDGTTKITTP